VKRVISALALIVLALAAPLPAAAAPLPATAAPAKVVPCPRVAVPPQPGAVASPLPVHNPNLPAVGGDQLATDGLATPPGSFDVPDNISAASWVVADLDSGEVVGACAAHRASAPASVQKLLLAATVLPKLDPKQVVTVTAQDMDFEAGSSAVGLVIGGQYTVETLWYGLLLASGNDAAQVLARLGGGDRGVPGTVADMNAEARKLGAFDTHVATPSGLDGPGQVTSAYDLALIARADFARPDFRQYTLAKAAQIPAQPQQNAKAFQIQNGNSLLYEYKGAIGGKTGFTDIARHTYVGAATRGGQTLVVTMLQGESDPAPLWEQGAALLDWGFDSSHTGTVGRLVKPGELRAPPTLAPTPTELAAPLAGPVGSPLVRWLVSGAAMVAMLGALVLRVNALRRRGAPAKADGESPAAPDMLNR
jgi:D-alanyl-D-alanine carboxypeptidase (penicillin-binding protein 5/6)